MRLFELHLCLLAALALAPPESFGAGTAPVTAGHAAQVVLGLLVVLGMILAAAWAARRLQVIRPRAAGRIRVLEGLAVGTRDKLLLVEVEGRRMLLGLSPGRIALLSELGSGEAAPAFDQALAHAGAELAGRRA
ncbi:MAG: flagellar biosynthetic protein FliO [Gammaproteobacteria bacterium]|nr:flagellar biosynthetic protein FliO [Gammaproteobacteria bacterium]